MQHNSNNERLNINDFRSKCYWILLIFIGFQRCSIHVTATVSTLRDQEGLRFFGDFFGLIRINLFNFLNSLDKMLLN